MRQQVVNKHERSCCVMNDVVVDAKQIYMHILL
jgi:hypothetical protein